MWLFWGEGGRFLGGTFRMWLSFFFFGGGPLLNHCSFFGIFVPALMIDNSVFYFLTIGEPVN